MKISFLFLRLQLISSLIYVLIFLILKIVGCLINSLLPTQHETRVRTEHFSFRSQLFHALESRPTANDMNILRKSYFVSSELCC